MTSVADAPVAHIGENSPEEVAYKLLQDVAYAEGQELRLGSTASKKADRKWILDAYAECLNAVRQPTGRVSSMAKGS
jgi:hypothetical protein